MNSFQIMFRRTRAILQAFLLASLIVILLLLLPDVAQAASGVPMLQSVGPSNNHEQWRKPTSARHPGCAHIYVVHRRDTLSKIAARFHVKTHELARVNQLRNPHRIHPGQRLCIPHTDRMPPRHESGFYTVRRGDTLSEIAQHFRTTVHALMKLNHLRNPHKIFVGQQLRVP